MSAMNNNGPNWLGLLRWSVQHSDGTAPSQFNAMSEEDKAWLERVMKEGVRDDAQIMNEIMCKVKDGDYSNLENDFEELRDIVEQVDMAQIFAKYGGCDLLIKVIEEQENSHLDDEIKALAASIIATVAQNNLQAQELLLKTAVIDKLVRLFVHSSSNILSTKLLFALSCCVRGHPAAEEVFSLKFLDLVVPKALRSRSETVVSRIAFLCNALITSDYCSEGRVKKIAELFIPSSLSYLTAANPNPVDLQENLFSLLSTLLQTSSGYGLAHDTFARDVELMIETRERLVSEVAEEEDRAQLISSLEVFKQHYHQSFQELFPSPTAKENLYKASSIPPPPPTNTPLSPHPLNPANPTNHNPDPDNLQTEGGEQQQPVLLLAPPPLEEQAI